MLSDIGQYVPQIIAIAVLLALSAFFSASETAISTANRIRLKTAAEKGNKTSVRALKLAENFDKTITTILIGNNIVNICSTSLLTVVCLALLGDKGAGIASVVMTVLVLIFGEILPKSLAKETADKSVLWMSAPLNLLTIVLTPVSTLFSALKKGVTKLFNVSSDDSGVSEEELMYIIEESEESGILEEQESDLVRSALEFDEISISEILVPRVSVTAVEINQPIEEILEVFKSEMYSRLPVYEKTIDSIVGIITFKSFMRLIDEENPSVRSIIQKPLYVSALKPINQVMHEMQKAKQHMAVVMDQFGGTEGIVTMEDIIEELVGEIYDESDEVVHPLVQISENAYSVSCDLSVNDMLEQLNLRPDAIETECTAVGGWVMELFESIPEKDETITSGIFTVTVTETDEQKLKKIRLEIAPHTTEKE